MKRIPKEEFIRLLRAQPVCIWGGVDEEQEIVRIDLDVEAPLWVVLWSMDGTTAIEIADTYDGGSDRNGKIVGETPDYVEASGSQVIICAANGNMEYLQFLQPWVVESDRTVKGTVHQSSSLD